MAHSSVLVSRFNATSLKHLIAVAMALIAITSMISITFIDAANAQRRNRLPLVRDAEIEALMRDYTGPIFKAGGLRRDTVEIFLLNRQEINAFVTGTRMFINTGTIMQSQTPNEVIGVIAHETGHIIGGHLTRLRTQLEKAQLLSVLTAIAAGAAARSRTGDPAA